MSNEKQDYIPFGEEWITGMKKHSKDVLIDLLANAYKKNISQENKWIKIESEADLPKERDAYWVIDKSGNVEKVTYHGKDDLSIRIWKTQFTHYHPIIKPDLPTI